MNRFLNPIVALILVPGLMADPATVSAMGTGDANHGACPLLQFSSNSQALAAQSAFVPGRTPHDVDSRIAEEAAGLSRGMPLAGPEIEPLSAAEKRYGWFARTMERPIVQKDAPFWGAGIAMLIYGLYARDALGWWGIALASFGIFWVLVGRPLFWSAAERWERFMDSVPDEFVTEPAATGPKTEADRLREWKWYWKGILLSSAITGFSLWRAWLTAWRPLKERYYFADHGFLRWIDHHWLGGALHIIDHSWVNDFLACPAAVAGSYLIFQLFEYVASHFTQETGSFLDERLSRAGAASWPDHKRRMQIILYSAAGLMLQSAWHEKVSLLGAAHWDKWDILAEGSGCVLIVWMIVLLLYPLFAKRQRFSPETVEIPNMRRMWPKILLDVAALFLAGIYLYSVAFLVATGIQTPFTGWERWMVPLEVTVVFLLYRFIVRWHVGRPSDLIPLDIGWRPTMGLNRSA